eukprot:gene9266-1543_t
MIKGHRQQRRNAALATTSRGKVSAKFDALYHGSVSCHTPTGNDMSMDAVSRIHELKLKPLPVIVSITDKGVYVDDRDTKELLKKVSLSNLSWVCTDPRNKHLFSFVYHEPRANRIEFHTFSMKKKGKEFVKACNSAIADMTAESSRAEAEAMLIAANTPIMPISLETRTAAPMTAKEQQDHHRKPWVTESYTTNMLGCFKAVYYGGTPVKEIEGFRVVQSAASRLKENQIQPKEVSLVITNTQIMLVERETGDHIQESPIQHISYSLLDPRDTEHFYYIINDPKLGFGCCHVLKLLNGFDAIAASFVAAHRCVARERQRAIEEGRIVAQTRKRTRKEAPKLPLAVYEVKYLGAVRVQETTGNNTVEKAMDNLRIRLQNILSLRDGDDWTYIGDRAVLVMTKDGIRVVELATGDVLHFTFIQDVTFTTHLHSGIQGVKASPSMAEHDIFAYIARDDKLSRIVCHFFKGQSTIVRDICKAAAAAMRLCLEDLQRLAGDNPFRIAGKSELNLAGLFPEHLLISRRDLRAIKVIGAGQFGTVWLALQQVQTGAKSAEKHRAVKLIRSGTSEQDQEDFVAEALTMSKLDHPNLVSLVGVCVEHMPWLVVLELMRYGDIKSVLIAANEKGIQLNYAEQLHLMVQLASGMSYVASQDIVHMDLAARNCLLHTNSVLKIGDFGLAKPFDEGKSYYKLKSNMNVKLPAKWMALESLQQLVFSEASDVWACGVTMWEIMSYGTSPYPQYQNKEMRRILMQGIRLKPPSDFPCPRELHDVMMNCWNENVDARWQFQHLRAELQEMFGVQMTSNSYELRDIGLLVNGGAIQELPTQRETVVELYTSYTFERNDKKQDGLNEYLSTDIEEIGHGKQPSTCNKPECDESYIDISQDEGTLQSVDDAYLDIDSKFRKTTTTDYFDVADSEDPFANAYFEVEGTSYELHEDSYLDLCKSHSEYTNQDDDHDSDIES